MNKEKEKEKSKSSIKKWIEANNTIETCLATIHKVQPQIWDTLTPIGQSDFDHLVISSHKRSCLRRVRPYILLFDTNKLFESLHVEMQFRRRFIFGEELHNFFVDFFCDVVIERNILMKEYFEKNSMLLTLVAHNYTSLLFDLGYPLVQIDELEINYHANKESKCSQFGNFTKITEASIFLKKM